MPLSHPSDYSVIVFIISGPELQTINTLLIAYLFGESNACYFVPHVLRPKHLQLFMIDLTNSL